jgi:glucose-1-phosphate cytidylyltransferase
MKAVILAGGYGTRLAEETVSRPKPMVEIGGRPILWHIMKLYSFHGINEFVVCCGYKGYQIKEFFANYFLHTSDVTFDLTANKMDIHKRRAEPWKVTLVDTGDNAMTGGRLLAVADYLHDEEAFCFTYGDGLSNVNISKTIDFHKNHGKLATITTTFPPGRFGALEIENSRVTSFQEKPRGDGASINGGYFVLSPKVIDYIDDESTTWEQDPLKRLAEDVNLMAYQHNDFWHPMDTVRDKQVLEKLWESGDAPWKVWK